jgi:Pyruvate/2-oxoacid:ferredoxin oxidoreductase delta subunit
VCEFCHQHGEGKKWYLEMKNYSKELLVEQKRSQYIEETRAHFEVKHSKLLTGLDRIRNVPFAYRFIRYMAEIYQKRRHWGQIVPIEDAEQVLDLQDSIVILPCRCRTLTRGEKEARYCFGVGIDTSDMLGKYPDYSGCQVVAPEEAKKLIRRFDQAGLVHSVWTFKTPYIGGLCNCDQDCLAYKLQVEQNLMNSMFRSEYLAIVDWDLCSGCRECQMYCQFGAVRFSHTAGKAAINTRNCYGCGVCRAVCGNDAIALRPRADFTGAQW